MRYFYAKNKGNMAVLFFQQLLGYADLGIVNFKIQTDVIHLDCISNLPQGINTETMEKSTKVVDTRQRTVREMSILGKRVYSLFRPESSSPLRVLFSGKG